MSDRPNDVEAASDTSALSGLFGRGMLYVVVGALPFVVATVVSPVLAYRLGPREFGLMASAIALHQVLVVLATVGLDQAIVLQRAEDGHDRSARGLITVGTLFAALVTLVVWATGPLWSPLLGFPGFDSLVLAAVLWTTPAVAVSLQLALLLGQDRLRAYTVVSTLSTVGSLLLGVLLLFTVANTVSTYAWGGVAGQVMACIVGLALARPGWRGARNLAVVRRALVLGLPLMLSGLSAFVLNAGDRLIIQRFLGPEEAGRYQVAYTVGFVAVTVLMLTGQSWSAAIAAVRDDAERLALIGRARDELYRVLGPAVLGVVLGAPLLLRIFAPASFRPESLLPVVLLVILAGYPVVATLASTRALIIARRTRPLAVSTAVAAALNIALNLLLVPRLGIVGAAAVTLVAFTVQAVLQRYALPSGTSWPRTPARLQLTFLLLCALATGSMALPQTVVWIVVRTVLAVLCLPWLLVHLKRARSLA